MIHAYWNKFWGEVMEQADKWDMLSESLDPKLSNGAGGVALGRREGISIAAKRAAPPKSRIRHHGTHARKLVLQPSPSLRSAQCDRFAKGFIRWCLS